MACLSCGFIGVYDRTADGGSITAGGFLAVITQTALKRREYFDHLQTGSPAWLVLCFSVARARTPATALPLGLAVAWLGLDTL